MHGDHGHDHSHELHLEDANRKEKKAFYLALWVAFFFMILEIVGGFIANSLALITDALHMFTDVGALFLGLIVIHLINRPATFRRSFGFQRAEVLGALANALTLWILVIFLVYEAIMRLIAPPPVDGPIVFVIACIGLVANLIMMKLLHPGETGSLNIRAAYLHVLGDLLGSVGVILAGAIIWWTDWYPADPIITIIFSVIILRASGKMMLHALDVLMESTPKSIDAEQVHKDLAAIDGVVEVHDLHIWAISTRRAALSVHLIASKPEKEILTQAHLLIKSKYKIRHMTIQIEDPNYFEPEFCYDCQKK